jgi:hypothetical protein
LKRQSSPSTLPPPRQSSATGRCPLASYSQGLHLGGWYVNRTLPGQGHATQSIEQPSECVSAVRLQRRGCFVRPWSRVDVRRCRPQAGRSDDARPPEANRHRHRPRTTRTRRNEAAASTPGAPSRCCFQTEPCPQPGRVRVRSVGIADDRNRGRLRNPLGAGRTTLKGIVRLKTHPPLTAGG